MALKKAKHGNRYITVEDAVSGISYHCPFCNARIYKKTSSAGNPFFSCYSGEVHTNSTCMLLVHRRVTHTLEGLDPEKFIDRLMKAPAERDKESLQENRTKPANYMFDLDEFLLSGGSKELSEENVNDSGGGEDQGGIERPFSSLRDIWEEGLAKTLDFGKELGHRKAGEVFIFQKWFVQSFKEFRGGKCVVQAHAERLVGEKTILLRSYWLAQSEWKHQDLRLVFNDKRMFFDVANQLLPKTEAADGSTKRKASCKWLLVAGNWTSYREVFKGRTYTGYRCSITSKRQIYMCPDEG